MSASAKVTLNNRIRFDLYRLAQQCRPEGIPAIRQQNRFFREFDIEDLELLLIENDQAVERENAIPSTTDKERAARATATAARLVALDAALPIPGPAIELEITERCASIFAGYLGRIAELFPAGKSPEGVTIPAGIPTARSRTLAPLIEQLAEAWPKLFPDEAPVAEKDSKAA